MALNINELPLGQQDKVRRQLGNGRRVKSYTKSQVVGAASSALTNPELKQYGMDGWEKHFEYMVTCEKCGDSFLSNEAGKALCNGRVYTGCPYCATDKEE